MAGNVVVEQASVSVVPGEMGTCSVRVRNTGTVVDQFTLTVLGQPAAWTTVVPAMISLFPGADGTIELHFAPPKAPGVGSGPQPFGVRVVGSQDPDNPVVEEGEVDLLPFVDVAAKVTPRTSETKRKARHDVIIDNKGNAPITVAISASDPDEQLAFELKESLVTVAAGQSHHVPLKVAARKGFARGGDKHRPFQVTARPEGSSYPLVLDANLIQKAGMPRFLVPLVAGVIAIALIAAVLPGVLAKSGGKGNLQLTSKDGATPTTAGVAADDGGAGDDGPATAAEAEAAAAAERAANGTDPGAGGSGGGGTGGGASAAGTGGGTSAGGGTTGGGGGESTGVTSPSATTAPAPGGGGSGGGGTGGTTATTAGGGTTATTAGGGGATTSTSAAPTTTAAPKTAAQSFNGNWAMKDGSAMAIAVSKGISVKVGSSVGDFTCFGSVADANDDGTFTGTSCSDGFAHVFTYLSGTDEVRMTYPSGGAFCPRTGCTVTWFRA